MPPLVNEGDKEKEKDKKWTFAGLWEEAKIEFKDVKFNLQNRFIAESTAESI